jgi:hypothetical protein
VISTWNQKTGKIEQGNLGKAISTQKLLKCKEACERNPASNNQSETAVEIF